MFFCGCFCPSVAPSRRMRCASSFRVFSCRSFWSGPIVEGEVGVAFVVSMFAEVLWSKRPRHVKGTTLQFERRIHTVATNNQQVSLQSQFSRWRCRFEIC